MYQMFTTTLGSACVIAAVTLLLFRIPALKSLAGKKSVLYQLLLLAIYGALSIYGTTSAIEVGGALCNVRDMAPLFAGLVGGPIAGIGAGLIGALYRLLIVGGATAWPCAIACVLAGVIGMVVWLICKKKVVRPVWGLLIAAVVEALHMVLLVIFGQTGVAQAIFLPVIIVGAVGQWLCLYVHKNVNGIN